jgi:hypothetical protein
VEQFSRTVPVLLVPVDRGCLYVPRFEVAQRTDSSQIFRQQPGISRHLLLMPGRGLTMHVRRDDRLMTPRAVDDALAKPSSLAIPS